jgi:hypothetical protein
MAQDSVSTSQKSAPAKPVSEISFGDRLGTASKFGLATMATGAIIGAIHGAKTGGSGGGYGAALGAMIGGGLGILKGGALGLAAGSTAGLIYSYASNNSKNVAAPTEKTTENAAPVSDLKGSQPVDASRDFWGDLSKGAITGTLAGTVTGAVIGGIKGGKSGGNFPMIGVALGGLAGALYGGGVGLVGGSAAGAIYSKVKD